MLFIPARKLSTVMNSLLITCSYPYGNLFPYGWQSVFSPFGFMFRQPECTFRQPEYTFRPLECTFQPPECKTYLSLQIK